jgi:hypothetical protein
MNTLRYKLAALLVLAVFVLSLANTQIVLADDVNPPTGTPTEVTPPQDPPVDPAVTLPEVLEQAPADPVWCPGDLKPGDTGCLDNSGAGYASLADLLTALAADPTTYKDAGTIYLEAGNLADTADVFIDQSVLGLSDLVVQGGWDGVFDSAGNYNLLAPSIFNGISLIIDSSSGSWNGSVTLKNLSIVNEDDSLAALSVDSTGQITLENVIVTGSQAGDGASLSTSTGGTDVGVAVTDSAFNENAGSGLLITSNGDVDLQTVVANENDDDGILVQTPGNVSFTEVRANLNTSDGAVIEAGGSVAVSNSEFDRNGEATTVVNTDTEDDEPGTHYYSEYDADLVASGSGLTITSYLGSGLGDVSLTGNDADANLQYGVFVHDRVGNLLIGSETLPGDEYTDNGFMWRETAITVQYELWNTDTGSWDYQYVRQSNYDDCTGAGLRVENLEGDASLYDVIASFNCSYGAYVDVTGKAQVFDSDVYENSGLSLHQGNSFESNYGSSTIEEDYSYAEVYGAGLYVEADTIVLEGMDVSYNYTSAGADLSGGDGGVSVNESDFYANVFYGSYMNDYYCYDDFCDYSYYNEGGWAQGTGLDIDADGPVSIDTVSADENVNGAYIRTAGSLLVKNSSFDDNESETYAYSEGYNGESDYDYEWIREQWYVSESTGLDAYAQGSITLEKVTADYNSGWGAYLNAGRKGGIADVTVLGSTFIGNGGYSEEYYWEEGYDAWMPGNYEYDQESYWDQGLGLSVEAGGIVTLTDVIASGNDGIGALVEYSTLAMITGGDFSENGAWGDYHKYGYEWPDGFDGGYYYYQYYEESNEGAGLALNYVESAIVSDVTAMANGGYGLAYGGFEGEGGQSLQVIGGEFSYNYGWYETDDYSENVDWPYGDGYEERDEEFGLGAGIVVAWTDNASVSITNVNADYNAVAGLQLDNSFGLLQVTGGSFDYNESYYDYYYSYSNIEVSGGEEDNYVLGDGIGTNMDPFDGGGAGLLRVLPETTSSVTITGSSATGNANSGFNISGYYPITLDRVVATGNGWAGAQINSFFPSSEPVKIICSTLSNNAEYGLDADMGGGQLYLTGLSAVDNGTQDVYVVDGVVIYGPCESGGGTQEQAPGLPYQYVPLPAVGGGAGLNCTQFSGTVIELPSGDRVTLPCPIQDTGKLRALPQDQLPAPLPQGTYISNLEAKVLWDGQELEKLPGRMSISFKLTEDQKQASLAILYWDKDANNKQGAWVELPARAFVDGVDQQFPLHDPADGKTTLVGAHLSDDGFFEVEVNFTGLFVLIQK